MIQPDRLVFPTGGKLKRIAGFADRDAFLEKPFILKNVGANLVFDFKADNVARFRSGNGNYLDPNVGNEFSAFDIGVAPLRCILVFHLEIFSQRGNAPATDAGDAGVGVVRQGDLAKVPAARAENFVGVAVNLLELAVWLHHQDFFRVEEDRIRFFIVGRQRGVGEGVHPGRRVAGDRRAREEREQPKEHERARNREERRFTCWPQRRQVRGRSAFHHWISPPERSCATSDKAPSAKEPGRCEARA